MFVVFEKDNTVISLETVHRSLIFARNGDYKLVKKSLIFNKFALLMLFAK